MKFLLSLALLALACTPLSAQLTSGSVTYEEEIHVEAQLDEQLDANEQEMQLPPEIAAQIKAAMADMGKFKKQLLLSPAATVYRAMPKEEKPVRPEQENFQFMVSSSEDNDIIHRDLKNNVVTQQRELLDKKFLISAPAEAYAWKITGESKLILEKQVMQATCTIDSTEITAWFCPQIPVSSGPAEFGGLPGLILEVSVGEDLTITAIAISTEAPVAEDLVAPKKGKKVTPEEFEKIAAEKRALMEEESGGGDVQMIIRMH